MPRDKLSVVLIGFLLLITFSAGAQETRVPRVGFISGRAVPTPSTPDPNASAFRQGLRDLGYVEGKNIALEVRYAEGKADLASRQVSELLFKQKVEVLVTPYSFAIKFAKQATKKIPIVFVVLGDPVAEGIVESFAHPGANITGISRLVRDLSGKRLELLAEVIPRPSPVGVLLLSGSPAATLSLKEYSAVAPSLRVHLQPIEVGLSASDLRDGFQTANKQKVHSLIVIRSPGLIDQRKQIAELAVSNRLPAMAEGNDFVEEGCLVSYGVNESDSFRHAATYVDKIVKGAKPSDLPVEQPTKIELVINLKTAKQIGLIIPPNVFARADRVIR